MADRSMAPYARLEGQDKMNETARAYSQPHPDENEQVQNLQRTFRL